MKNRKKHSIKKWAGRLHLWLGLITGLVVFIVAITGCIYVFQDEIKDLVHDWRKVEPEKRSFIEPSQLRIAVKEHYPDASNNFVIYAGRDRPAAVYSADGEKQYYFHFNPYSGEFLHAQDFDTDFFDIIRNLHMYLLLPEKLGRQVVGISTIIFLLMLITGIILWWPRKLKNLKNALKVKWNARWRRLNYDLHNVSGFDIHLLAIIIAVTGLYFSYEWVSDGLYELGNLGKDYKSDKVVTKVLPRTKVSGNPIDLAFYESMELLPGQDMYFVWDNGEKAPITTGAYPESLDFDHQTNFYFHPQTAELLQTHFYSEKSPGMKLQEMSYGLHTGQYLGLAGKILAFIASLFIASLPVTGFLVWWGRKNRMEHLTR
ncbi:PepSY domain-containing protein [Gramella jeungdoensis]|uniref:PepSY domain-containing protein n=1 Tax=Gramella jeungdoensis TaxID=708091 RepID=A0ABT0YXR9_9FLAO|nr:PepSY-associated TM helix domain-containing protein [Gramella jeungdoensis]MCM8568265.1 PepSY domain-containing protein [Gramella jeungdoensis]